MKIKRYKKVQKHMNFYINNFGFRVPYQILIDATFCLAALKNKIDIEDQLPKYFQKELKLLTTQCIILEAESLGKKVAGATVIVKKFAIHKCGHEKSPISGSECLKDMMKNESHYVVATQDRGLQKWIKNKPGQPLLYLHQMTPVLDEPSHISKKRANKISMEKIKINKNTEETIEKLKINEGVPVVNAPVKPNEIKNKKRKKGPNPLSCKKKNNLNKNNKINKASDGNKSRNRIPKHIRQQMKVIKVTQQ